MRHPGTLAALVFATGLGTLSTPAIARTYLAVPGVGWNELEPYARANIVAFLTGDKFEVFICSGQTDRSVVASYDESVGDFTKALLYELLLDDEHFHEAVEIAADEFRKRVPSLSPADRERFRELYWTLLSGSPDVLPRVRWKFYAARADGRLRCGVCDQDASLYPAAARWRK